METSEHSVAIMRQQNTCRESLTDWKSNSELNGSSNSFNDAGLSYWQDHAWKELPTACTAVTSLVSVRWTGSRVVMGGPMLCGLGCDHESVSFWELYDTVLSKSSVCCCRWSLNDELKRSVRYTACECQYLARWNGCPWQRRASDGLPVMAREYDHNHADIRNGFVRATIIHSVGDETTLNRCTAGSAAWIRASLWNNQVHTTHPNFAAFVTGTAQRILRAVKCIYGSMRTW